MLSDMKKSTKIIIIIAACVALLVTSIGIVMNLHEKEADDYQFRINDMTLEEGNAIPLVNDITEDDWAFRALSYEIDMSIPLPIICEGSFIDTVEYSIENGYFQIVRPLNESYALAIENNPDEIYMICAQDGAEDRTIDNCFSVVFDYTNQKKENCFLNIYVGNSVEDDSYEALFKDENGIMEEMDAQKTFDAIADVIRPIIVHCKMNFKSGDSKTVDLCFAVVMQNNNQVGIVCGIPDSDGTLKVEGALQPSKEVKDQTTVTEPGDTIVAEEIYYFDPFYDWSRKRKEFVISVDSAEFNYGDFDFTEEQLQNQVDSAIGLKAGDTFRFGYEGGDSFCNILYRIIEIKKK